MPGVTDFSPFGLGMTGFFRSLLEAVPFPLYIEVALATDLPEEGLRRGDVGTIVEHFPVDGEDGYALEIFNAIGETVKVVVVAASAIRTLRADEVWSARALT